jgi:hypothetical protein
MAKKVLFGFVWCVVFYFVACMFVGGVAGGIAGTKYPGNIPAAQEAGRIAGEKAVTQYLPYIAFSSVTLAILGSGAGILPGTKTIPRPESY